MSRIVALCGGVGGAKLAFGLAKVLPPNELTIIVNTGDDFEHLDSPSVPTLIRFYTPYRVARVTHMDGDENESWHAMEELGALRSETWFKLCDKDIALHLTRLHLLHQGLSLTQVTRALAGRLGVLHAVLRWRMNRYGRSSRQPTATFHFRNISCVAKVSQSSAAFDSRERKVQPSLLRMQSH